MRYWAGALRCCCDSVFGWFDVDNGPHHHHHHHQIRKAQEIAGRAAAEDAASGGIALDRSKANSLVVRGEDVMTQVTNAIVCLLRVRPPLSDHAASLGFVSKVGSRAQTHPQPAC